MTRSRGPRARGVFTKDVTLMKHDPESHELLAVQVRGRNNKYIGLAWFSTQEMCFYMINTPYPNCELNLVDYSFERLRECVKQTFPKHYR